MAKLPKYEQQVDFKPAMQPFSTGDGYEAPGRGLQRVGQGIASLGQGIASLQGEVDKDDEFNAKLAMLKLSNEQDLDDMQSKATFNPDTGDVDGYAAGRLTRFQERANDALSGIRSERARRNAMLHIERMRGTVGERASAFQIGVRQQKLFSGAERAITGEFDKIAAFTPVEASADAENQAGYAGAGAPPATADPGAQYMQRFEGTLRAAEAIIADMPATPQQKQALSKHAASLAMAALGRKQDAWPAVEQWLARQREAFGEPQPGGAPRMGDPPAASNGSGPDYRGRGGPAAIRYNNPGAMWPGSSSRKFGAVDVVTLNDHQRNKIAVFPDAVSGAAAQFDLLERKYTGKTLTAAIRMWSGGNSSAAYASKVAAETGLTPDSVLTRDMIRDPRIAIPIARSMASMEAGRKEYPLEAGQWAQAHQMAFGKGEAQARAGAAPAVASEPRADAPTRLAQAPTGTVIDAAPRPLASAVRSELTESLLRAAPAMKEAHRKQVEGMIDGLEGMAIKGQQAPDVMVADLTARAARSGDPALMQRMALMPAVLAVSRAENQASPQQLTAVIQQAEAMAQQGPITPQQAAQLDHLKKKRTETERALAANAYEHGTRVGILPGPVPEIKAAVPPEQLKETLDARVAARSAMETRMGEPVPLLQGREQQELLEFMAKSGAPPEARLAVMRAMFDALGPAAMLRDMKQIFEKDAPHLAQVGWLMANNADPMAMKDAMRGLDLRRTDGFVSRVPESKDEIRRVTDQIVGVGNSAFAAMPGADGYAIEVAKLIYEARAFDKGLDPKLKTLEPSLWKESLNEAMGQNKVGDVTYGGIGAVGGGIISSGAPVFVIASVKTQGGLQEIMSKIRMSDLIPVSPALGAAAAAGREEDGSIKVFDQMPESEDQLVNERGAVFSEGALEKGATSIALPVTAGGRPVPIGAIRSAVPVWAGGSTYYLRTGTDARGQPEFIKNAAGENYRLDIGALRETIAPRVSKDVFRPMSDAPTVADILAQYRAAPGAPPLSQEEAKKPRNWSEGVVKDGQYRDQVQRFTPRFAPGKTPR